MATAVADVHSRHWRISKMAKDNTAENVDRTHIIEAYKNTYFAVHPSKAGCGTLSNASIF